MCLRDLRGIPFRVVRRFVLVALVSLTWTIAAGAYTLVFRDGRRIEVPPEFVLTSSTLTYEVAPGLSKTVQLVLVDVAATERANHEANGAFFKHAEPRASLIAPPAAGSARVTLTNRELETARQRRVKSELEYEKRRIELGLPSIEETRRRRAQEEDALLAQARARALDNANDEAYWRDRARALREEITANDAEINYLQSRLSEIRQFPLATSSLITSVLPLIPLATNSALAPFPNRGGFASLPLRRGLVLSRQSSGSFRSRQLASPFGFTVPFASGYGAPFLPARPFDYTEDIYALAGLSDRLDSLLVLRVGLAARWRQLEDEARDAKAPQIWLEP